MAGGGPFGSGTLRPQRRARPRPRPMVPHGPGGQQLRPAPRHPYIPPSARSRPRRIPLPRERPQRPSAAFGPISGQGQPFRRAQRKAAQKTRRAQDRLPQHAVPQIPIIRNPTPQQQRAVKQAIIRHVNTTAGRGASNAETLVRRRAVLQDLSTSKAGRRFLDTGRYYAGVEQRTPSFHNALVRNARDRVAPGPQHKRIGVPLFPAASIDTTTLGHSISDHLASGGAGNAAAHFVSKSGPQFLKRGGADALNFPKNAVVGGYETARAANDLAGYLPGSPQKGSTKRAKRLADGMTRGFVGELVIHGDPEAAKKALSDHPLYSALEVTGAGQVAGRLAGAAARRGALGARLAERASTKRAPLRYGPGAGQVKHRSYSANLGVQEAQRFADRQRAKQGHDPNVARGKRQERLLNQQTDEFAGQAEGRRRRGRTETAQVARRITPVRRGKLTAKQRQDLQARQALAPRGTRTRAALDRTLQRSAEASALPGRVGRARVERDVVLAAVEGRLHGPKTFKRDLTRERDRLQAVWRQERSTMPRAIRQANRRQVKALDRVLGDPRALANAEEVFRAAHDYKTHSSHIENQLIAHKALDPDQALAAKVRPYAVSQMGARHDPTLAAPEHLTVRHAQAREAESAAKETLGHVEDRVRRLEAQRQRAVGSNRTARGQEHKPQAAYYVGKERFTTHAEAVAHAKQAGGEVKRVALTTREAGRTGELARLDRAIKAAKHDRSEARRAHAHARDAREASDPKKYATGLVDARGKKLSTEQVIADMRANPNHGGGVGEVDLPGFVSHRPDTTGASSYFVNWFNGRKTIDANRRTGESTRTGGHGSGYQALEEHLVRGQGVVDAIKTFDDFIGQFGVKRPDGKHYTWAQAQDVAGDMSEAYGREMVPMRAAPARYEGSSQQEILDRQGTANSQGELDSLVRRNLDEARQPPPEGQAGAENVVLVPKMQVERFAGHQTVGSTAGGKAGQALSRAFRSTVLPFSAKWLFGNSAEALLRSGINGITPLDVVRGGRVMRELRKLDEEKYKAMDTRVRGGLLYGDDRLSVRRDAKDFENTALETPAKALAQVARVPVVRQLGTGIRAYQHAVFALNRGVEKAFQTGVIGKQARKEAQELTGMWHKALGMQEGVAKEVAAGLLETPKQVQYARYMDEVLGKYSRFSPSTRRAIQTFAPFLPWYLNSAKFVLYTLPFKHPAKTALLANVETTLHKDIAEQQSQVPPGDLESAIHRSDGGLVPLARYTPFGAFTNLPEGLTDPLLPQISGLGANFAGRSWSGGPLKLESGERGTAIGPGKRATLGLYSMLEGIAPGLAIIRRAQEGGRTAFDDSKAWAPKTKPGTSYGTPAWRRIMDPLRPTYLNAPTSGGGKPLPGGSGPGISDADLKEIQRQAQQQSAGISDADLKDIERAVRQAGG